MKFLLSRGQSITDLSTERRDLLERFQTSGACAHVLVQPTPNNNQRGLIPSLSLHRNSDRLDPSPVHACQCCCLMTGANSSPQNHVRSVATIFVSCLIIEARCNCFFVNAPGEISKIYKMHLIVNCVLKRSI